VPSRRRSRRLPEQIGTHEHRQDEEDIPNAVVLFLVEPPVMA
jgi:hypothetical protein